MTVFPSGLLQIYPCCLFKSIGKGLLFWISKKDAMFYHDVFAWFSGIGAEHFASITKYHVTYHSISRYHYIKRIMVVAVGDG